MGEKLAATYGQELAAEGGRIAAPDLWVDTVRDFTIAEMMAQVRADLKLLGVEPDVFSSERALMESGVVNQVIDRLEADGLIERIDDGRRSLVRLTDCGEGAVHQCLLAMSPPQP